MSTRFFRENKIIPIELKNNVLKVIMSDPDNREVIEALKVASAADIVVYTGDPGVIEDHISKFYSQETQNINRIIEGIEDEDLEFIGNDDEEDIGHLKD